MIYICDGYYFKSDDQLNAFRKDYELRYGSFPDYEEFVEPPTRKLHWGWIEVWKGFELVSSTQSWIWDNEIGTDHEANGFKVRYLQ